jgi:hypothetical protein
MQSATKQKTLTGNQLASQIASMIKTKQGPSKSLIANSTTPGKDNAQPNIDTADGGQVGQLPSFRP